MLEGRASAGRRSKLRDGGGGHSNTEIPAIDCPVWCSDPGHATELARTDQACYSDSNYVGLSLEEVELGPAGKLWQPSIRTAAHRAFNANPVVLVQIEVDDLDLDLHLTATEAWQLAQHLKSVSALVSTSPRMIRAMLQLFDVMRFCGRRGPRNLARRAVIATKQAQAGGDG